MSSTGHIFECLIMKDCHCLKELEGLEGAALVKEVCNWGGLWGFKG